MAVELTTIVRVYGADATVLPELAANLEAALVEAIANLGMAAVKAYFVAPEPHGARLRVGLRFEGMEAEHIEDAASELLDETFKIANGEVRQTRELRRVGSQLVSA